MSRLVQGQSGSSIADIYDVVGSVAPIKSIDVEDVKAVHDVAGTIASERFGGQTIRVTQTVSASQTIAILSIPLPIVISRVLGIALISDDASRIANVGVMLQTFEQGGLLQEIPIWVWAGGANFITQPLIDFGNSSADFDLLSPRSGVDTKILTFGSRQPQSTERFALRGASTAFGAGTVTVTALIYLAHAVAQGGISSFGIPVPSW